MLLRTRRNPWTRHTVMPNGERWEPVKLTWSLWCCYHFPRFWLLTRRRRGG